MLEADPETAFVMRQAELDYADVCLSRIGVYLAYERIARRPPSSKTPQATTALVVEDDPDQRALAVRRLTGAGYRAESVDCVRALHAALERFVPDALFLDVNLPDGDGFHVLQSLRRARAFGSLPIIMLTARVERADVAKGLALGADGYVTKPYRPNTLDYVLRYVMQQEMR